MGKKEIIVNNLRLRTVFRREKRICSGMPDFSHGYYNGKLRKKFGSQSIQFFVDTVYILKLKEEALKHSLRKKRISTE